MRAALIDVDGHNFPNLPLMKLSAWHKRNGDQIEWYDPFEERIAKAVVKIWKRKQNDEGGE